jgi:hypothetical protein
MKSLAYQSLQASPMAPAWGELSAPAPSASVTRRLDSPCVYSWKSSEASSPPVIDRKSPVQRYSCIVGDSPSIGVSMFPLLRGLEREFAPSSVCSWSLSTPSKEWSVNEIGGSRRWSW